MTARELRKAAVKDMRLNRSVKVAKAAHKIAWLMEERGYSLPQTYTRLSIRKVFAVQTWKQYRMTQDFILKGVADTGPRVPGSIIGKAARTVAGGGT